MFAAGALALFLRKSSQDQWADFPKLLVLAIPCVLLYALGTGSLRLGRADEQGVDGGVIPAWRSAALVLGLLLVPLALSQLVETLGGNPDKAGHTTWIFLATAAAGAFAAFVRGLRWGALFAGLALIVSWVAFWDAVTDPSATTIRWLFIVIGVGLALAAARLHREGRIEAPELVTAAGVAGIAAGITGLISIATQLLSGAIASAFGGDSDLSGVQQRQEWDAFLLILALALIWYGTRAVWRGPVYVGALALFAFILSVGVEVTAFFSGDAPTGDVVGWPLLLLVLGVAALLGGLYGGSDRAEPATPSGTVPPPAPPPGPPQP